MPEHWSNATPIRKVFKGAFEQAGLPYFNRTVSAKHWCNSAKRSAKALRSLKPGVKIWAMKGVLTTFFSYGEVQQSRQSAIFKALQVPRVSLDLQRVDELAKAVAREMRMQMESSG